MINDITTTKLKNKLLSKKPTINININNINIQRSSKKSKSHKPKNPKGIIVFHKPKEKINNEKFNDRKLNYLNYEHALNYNDRELNYLNYEHALNYDTRNFIQYYISLLKQNHIIIFTFIQKDDYNLFSLKIILFFISFSLFYTMNGFFFKDSTMNRIYQDKGKYRVIYQVPQIIYSFIVAAIVNTILKQLALSESNILKLKRERNNDIAQKKSRSIRGCLCLKFILFFIFSLLFMAFFWYFISCFCAVFLNTQIILIKDTLISFSLSMIYPFFICLLPGIFRIFSLKYKRQSLYKFSLLLSFL